MSEVHRYQVVTMLSASGATIGYDPHGPDVVMASAFDEATRLFLDAAERCVAAERREKELQQRLTAADERADRLEQALKFYADGDHLLLADPDAWDTCSGEPVNFLHDDAGTASVEDGSIAKAALKPVESSGKPCACPGCDSPRCANSPFCVAHRSAKSRTRGQDPLTADGLEWLTQNDGYQQ